MKAKNIIIWILIGIIIVMFLHCKYCNHDSLSSKTTILTEQDNASLKAELKTAKRDKKIAEDYSNKLKDSIQILKDRLDDLWKKLNDNSFSLKKSKDVITKLKEELDNCNHTIIHLKSKLEESLSKLEELNASLYREGEKHRGIKEDYKADSLEHRPYSELKRDKDSADKYFKDLYICQADIDDYIMKTRDYLRFLGGNLEYTKKMLTEDNEQKIKEYQDIIGLYQDSLRNANKKNKEQQDTIVILKRVIVGDDSLSKAYKSLETKYMHLEKEHENANRDNKAYKDHNVEHLATSFNIHTDTKILRFAKKFQIEFDFDYTFVPTPIDDMTLYFIIRKRDSGVRTEEPTLFSSNEKVFTLSNKQKKGYSYTEKFSIPESRDKEKIKTITTQWIPYPKNEKLELADYTIVVYADIKGVGNGILIGKGHDDLQKKFN